MKTIGFVGLDVHAEKLAVAVAEPDGEVRFPGVIPNRQQPYSYANRTANWDAQFCS